MTEPALAPRNALVGVIGVWVAAFLAALAVGIFVPEPDRVPWLLVSFGGAVLLAFAIQLRHGRTQGFIFRVAGSVTGALLVMGLISVGFGLATLVPA